MTNPLTNTIWPGIIRGKEVEMNTKEALYWAINQAFDADRLDIVDELDDLLVLTDTPDDTEGTK